MNEDIYRLKRCKYCGILFHPKRSLKENYCSVECKRMSKKRFAESFDKKNKTMYHVARIRYNNPLYLEYSSLPPEIKLHVSLSDFIELKAKGFNFGDSNA